MLNKFFVFLFCISVASQSLAAKKNVIVDEESGAMVNLGDEPAFNDSSSGSGKWSAQDPNKGFLNIDEEGAYHYSETEDQAKEYDTASNWKPKEENIPKGLVKMQNDGSYLYQTVDSDQDSGSSLKMGSMTVPNIKNETGTLSFKDFYGSKPISVILYDYEWQNLWGLKNLSFSMGTGLGTTVGAGRFKSDPTIEAREKYTFYTIPNHISLSYRFQYIKRQWIAPYVSAGFMPIGIVEYRDDGEATTLTKALAAQTSGGLKFNLNSLDIQAAFNLDSEYGINECWFDLELKLIQGLDSKVDFTSQVIDGGFGFDF